MRAQAAKEVAGRASSASMADLLAARRFFEKRATMVLPPRAWIKTTRRLAIVNDELARRLDDEERVRAS